MHKIDKKIEHALMALKMLYEQPNKLIQVSVISEATKASFDGLSKVMQRLVQHQILKSEQGASGGYALNKDLSGVSFRELVEAALGPVHIVKCMKGNYPCDIESTCNIKDSTHILNEKLLEFYSSLSVKDLMAETENPSIERAINE